MVEFDYKVRKWGNSLVIAIAKMYREILGDLKEGDLIHVKLDRCEDNEKEE